ncbi:metallophosphoesterase family protein [Phreatobacter stygius]|uniref:DNA repair exonuclease n=1 Tax=Phreatobacter stygius TaxID=1940610 RepID=A0A4D7AWB1_9HYPH|nr:DNA repair exonuclease [Phreatobacter stygius]QCI64231.1 DNA repair exonuclease [Phreatobacter stygius]
MAYRFVHAADVHLDSPLRSLALRNPDLAELIGNATRRAFTNIVDLCLNEQVDALLLAGDLYDGDQTSMKTARFLAMQIRRLDEAGIRVFIIRGNHDALSRITKELTLPDTVKVFGGRAEAVSIERSRGDFAVAIHGISFANAHAAESLLPKYKAPLDGAVNIALMHTSLAGAAGHDPYAPCSIADLGTSGFDYWALGHVHRRAVVESPRAIVMPGMPQGRDINEAGPKSVTLVTVADDRSIQMEQRFTSVAQFERVAVNVDGIEDWRALVAAMTRAFEQARERTQSEHLVARLSITGTTPLAWQIRRDADLLKAEADDRASVIGKSWVEKLEIDCTAPGVVAGAPADPLAELHDLIAGEVLSSSAYAMELTVIAEELRAQLPVECRTIFGTSEEAFKAALGRLAREGAEDVLARLHAAADGGQS